MSVAGPFDVRWSMNDEPMVPAVIDLHDIIERLHMPHYTIVKTDRLVHRP